MNYWFAESMVKINGDRLIDFPLSSRYSVSILKLKGEAWHAFPDSSSQINLNI